MRRRRCDSLLRPARKMLHRKRRPAPPQGAQSAAGVIARSMCPSQPTHDNRILTLLLESQKRRRGDVRALSPFLRHRKKQRTSQIPTKHYQMHGTGCRNESLKMARQYRAALGQKRKRRLREKNGNVSVEKPPTSGKAGPIGGVSTVCCISFTYGLGRD